MIALGVRLGHLLDLDAALGGAHQQDPALRAVEDRGEVELLDDVRGRPDEDLAHGHALDVHPEDRDATASASSGGARELHAAGLAAPADEDLGLDDDLARQPAAEEPLGRRPRLGRGVGDLPGRDRQALGDEQRLGVGFVEFHARQAPVGWTVTGTAMVPRRLRGDAPLTESGTERGRRLAILIERGHVGRATAEGRDAARPRGASAEGRS